MNGFILYQGPSTIDGAPIVVIITGLLDGGSNSKTGPMAQVYILRSDVSPIEAANLGMDVSICGTCPHRGRLVLMGGVMKLVERSCYVNLGHGPRVVFKAFKDGRYPVVSIAKARKWLALREVRFGAYGDPGAVPMEIWDQVLGHVSDSTAYTHLWRQYPELAKFCMASVDSEAERLEAKALGFRTFRVRAAGAPTMKGEGQCPASDEMISEEKNPTMQCARCMLCNGRRAALKVDITIQAHGSGKIHYERREAAQASPIPLVA